MSRSYNRKLTRPILFLLVICWLLVSRSLGTGSIEVSGQTWEEVSVVRVVDGDTIIVDRDGKKERVRMVGMNCEESVLEDESRNTEKGRIASAFTKELLPPGTIVYLEQDVSDRDTYDRLLRYIWLEVPEGDITMEDVRDKTVNGILVREGHAKAKNYPPDVKYSEFLHSIK